MFSRKAIDLVYNNLFYVNIVLGGHCIVEQVSNIRNVADGLKKANVFLFWSVDLL